MRGVKSTPLLLGGLAFLFTLSISTSTSPSSTESPLTIEIKRITKVPRPSVEIKVNASDEFTIFCRVGERKFLAYYFRTAMLRITSAAEDIKLIRGHGPKDVYLQYRDYASTKWLWWISNALPWRVRDTHFPTFNTSCVGISTDKEYSAVLIIRPLDPWKLVVFLAGLSLFFYACELSRSRTFFFSTGTLMGALGAGLVLLFILSKYLPKGKAGLSFLSVLWALGLYFAGETWKRFGEFLERKAPYVVAYVGVGALLSFLACYRWGPPSHPKTLDIMRWVLQGLGLVLIHFSSDFVEMSTSIILLLLAYHNAKVTFWYYAERYYRRMFPPAQRLLSEEEFIAQGAIETKKQLEELREYCSSPESKPWKLVTKLKNPRRFSEFIEGSPHLSDAEVLAYDSESDGEMDGPPLPLPPAGRARVTPPQQQQQPHPRRSNRQSQNLYQDLLTDDSEFEEGNDFLTD